MKDEDRDLNYAASSQVSGVIINQNQPEAGLLWRRWKE